jgi:hypothetical protein
MNTILLSGIKLAFNDNACDDIEGGDAKTVGGIQWTVLLMRFYTNN